MHDGDPVLDRRVVQQIARRKVVGAVNDHVVVGDDPVDVLRGEALLISDDPDVRIQSLERTLGRFDLRLADPIGRVEDLALQVREVDDVGVHDP